MLRVICSAAAVPCGLAARTGRRRCVPLCCVSKTRQTQWPAKWMQCTALAFWAFSPFPARLAQGTHCVATLEVNRRYAISRNVWYSQCLVQWFILMAPSGSSKPPGGCHKGVTVEMRVPHLAHGTLWRAHPHPEQSEHGSVSGYMDHWKCSCLQCSIRCFVMPQGNTKSIIPIGFIRGSGNACYQLVL